MNRRQEKRVKVIVGRKLRDEITIGPETVIEDVCAMLDLPSTCSFSLTRSGDLLPPAEPIFAKLRHRGRVYAWITPRLTQLDFDFGASATAVETTTANTETNQHPGGGPTS